MRFEVHPFNTLGNYFCVDIMALYREKWIFCKHKDRITWENPGGHIDEGETSLEAAKRELYEETGAIDFDIEPLCDYYIEGEIEDRFFQGNVQVYFANVYSLGGLPTGSEMELIEFFDFFPNNLRFPMSCEFFTIASEKKENISKR